ncbi:MAG: hypothetical protein EBW38_10310 [Rhodobacteraceae bacterium]|nr:hypothetical protein [Paracoccaceae bacterium]
MVKQTLVYFFPSLGKAGGRVNEGNTWNETFAHYPLIKITYLWSKSATSIMRFADICKLDYPWWKSS